MCGRFVLKSSAEQIQERFKLTKILPHRTAHFNIAPSQNVLGVREEESDRSLFEAHWGLIPSWAKDKKIAFKMINARAETLSEKPSFRSAFKSRRCLVPTDGFYEWKPTSEKTKQPYFIRLKEDGLFAFAGIWERWKSPEGEIVESLCIVTRDADKQMREFHDRMPCILMPEDYEAWLSSRSSPKELQSLLSKEPPPLEIYAVSTQVNSPKNDRPELLEKVSA